jgi:hypothetical protein
VNSLPQPVCNQITRFNPDRLFLVFSGIPQDRLWGTARKFYQNRFVEGERSRRKIFGQRDSTAIFCCCRRLQGIAMSRLSLHNPAKFAENFLFTIFCLTISVFGINDVSQTMGRGF